MSNTVHSKRHVLHAAITEDPTPAEQLAHVARLVVGLFEMYRRGESGTHLSDLLFVETPAFHSETADELVRLFCRIAASQERFVETKRWAAQGRRGAPPDAPDTAVLASGVENLLMGQRKALRAWWRAALRDAARQDWAAAALIADQAEVSDDLGTVYEDQCR